MLTIARLTDRSGRYYLSDLATELSGLSVARSDGSSSFCRRAGTVHGQWCGRWVGDGSAAMGLAGDTDERSLSDVLGGRHPRSGRVLRARPAGVSSYDLTFAAPKSVSVLFGLGSSDVAHEVLDAHASAVGAALGYVSSHALAVRRGTGDERHLILTAGVVAAAFTHGVSRALDPHLHTHVVVANVAHGVDGRWTAIDGRGLYAHARAAGALYDAHLRRELTDRLDVSWSLRRNHSYELATTDPGVLGALSGRQAEIRAHLAEHRRPAVDRAVDSRTSSRRAREVAWAATREEKVPMLTPRALRRMWVERASVAAFTHPAPTLSIDRPSPHKAPYLPERRSAGRQRLLDEYRFSATLSTSAHPSPTRRDVAAAWSRALESGGLVREVNDCVDALADWPPEVGVGERRRALADVIVAPHLLRALGPRPGSPTRLTTWLAAASAVERYRSHWGLEHRLEPLGVDGSHSSLARLGPRRLAEHLSVLRVVDDVRRRMGHEVSREPDTRQLARGR